MGRIDLALPVLTDQQEVLSHLPNLVIVNQQFRFADPHRQQLPHQLPRRGVPVVAIADATFLIHDAIHDLRRVVIPRGKRQ